MDDYNWHDYFHAGNIPDYIKADELDIVFNEALKIIHPATTGFSDLISLATLILPKSQKYMISPFHIIPRDRQSVTRKDHRSVPAVLNDGSYISSML